MFKRHYIDDIEYPSSPVCGENPIFIKRNLISISPKHLGSGVAIPHPSTAHTHTMETHSMEKVPRLGGGLLPPPRLGVLVGKN